LPAALARGCASFTREDALECGDSSPPCIWLRPSKEKTKAAMNRRTPKHPERMGIRFSLHAGLASLKSADSGSRSAGSLRCCALPAPLEDGNHDNDTGMRSFRLPTRTQILGAAAVAFVGLFILRTTARAECGDYVVLGHHLAMPLSSVHDQHLAVPNHRAPCSGPSCRHQPADTPVPAVPTPSPRSPEWGSLNTGIASAEPMAAATIAPRDAGRPIQRGTDVYHPPRRS
jgi:hypothetical protein